MRVALLVLLLSHSADAQTPCTSISESVVSIVGPCASLSPSTFCCFQCESAANDDRWLLLPLPLDCRCCTGNNCAGNSGMPRTCEGDCIAAFGAFYSSCQTLIAAEANADAYARFLAACQGNGDATDFRPQLPAPGGPDALEVGTVFADEQDVVVSFQRSYSRPIVFAG